MNLTDFWGGRGCKMSCNGHHQQGQQSAPDVAEFDLAQILAYPIWADPNYIWDLAILASYILVNYILVGLWLRIISPGFFFFCQTYYCSIGLCLSVRVLTHWGRDKMADFFRTTFSNAFSSMKMCEFRLNFHFHKFVSKDPINNISALVKIMAWRRPGDKPLSEPMMIILLTHICVTRPQWVN